jgi:hypothetical protein
MVKMIGNLERKVVFGTETLYRNIGPARIYRGSAPQYVSEHMVLQYTNLPQTHYMKFYGRNNPF